MSLINISELPCAPCSKQKVSVRSRKFGPKFRDCSSERWETATGGGQTKQKGVTQNWDEGLRQVKLYPIKLPWIFILCCSPAPEKDEKQANINPSYLSVSSAVSPSLSLRNDCVYSHFVFCEYVALYSLICIQIIQMCCKFFFFKLVTSAILIVKFFIFIHVAAISAGVIYYYLWMFTVLSKPRRCITAGAEIVSNGWWSCKCGFNEVGDYGSIVYLVLLVPFTLFPLRSGVIFVGQIYRMNKC